MDGNLFEDDKPEQDYGASAIESLDEMEAVRLRPGMYVGGTDERALHHLVAEILDNSMDEAVAGHASRIEVELHADGSCTVSDNGRGIPVDQHPKHKDKTALEVVFTKLHAGGKFSGKAYETSGGLHGVGAAVVNALSDRLKVEVARGKQLYAQEFSRGIAQGGLQKLGPVQNRRGTTVNFHPDADIFGARAALKPARLHRMARSKAYLFRGVEIRWKCAPELIGEKDETPEQDTFRFPGGLADYLTHTLQGTEFFGDAPFSGKVDFRERFQNGAVGSVEWALAWTPVRDGATSSYCNTIPTPEGGTHEAGFWAAVTKGMRAHGELVGNKKAANITREDVQGTAAAMISAFIRDPEFVGQTKDRLATTEASKLVEASVRDRIDTWLAGDPKTSGTILDYLIERADERMRRRQEKETQRKSATKKLRLPGKLADCSSGTRDGSEIFLVEGDSAGGSAKQARDRQTQAVLPLRGKILNVLGAASSKLSQNQELNDLMQALGVGLGKSYRNDDLRYDKVIIMTDADVDGAHIAALLMTFFFTQMRPMIDAGHLYLAAPPLYWVSQGSKKVYAADETERDQLISTGLGGKGKVEYGRFKGLGEMNPKELKDTTMSPDTRTLIRVSVSDDEGETGTLVEQLMGKKPELRFQYIQENAQFAEDLDI